MRLQRVIALTALILGLAVVASAGNNEDFKGLGALYSAKDGKEACRQELLAQVSERDPLVLWEGLWKETEPVSVAAKALALVDALCADGNAAQWTRVSGFLMDGQYEEGVMTVPPSVPRQIVVLESALAGISALSEIGDPRALWVARDLFFALKEAGEFSAMAEVSDPGGFKEMRETFFTARKMVEINGVRPFPWGDRSMETLPLNLRKLGYFKDPVSFLTATAKKMFMLNHDGQYTAAIGEFAWDWKETGNTYLILDSERLPEGSGGRGIR